LPRDAAPIVVAVTGGLGNQLFQLAAAVAVASVAERRILISPLASQEHALKRAARTARILVRFLLADGPERFRMGAQARRLELLEIQSLADECPPAEHRRLGLRPRSMRRAFREPGWDHPSIRPLRTVEDAARIIRDPGALPPEVTPMLVGQMQSDDLVHPVLAQLRAAIKLPDDRPHPRRWIEAVSARVTVGVHVRRGDYCTPSNRRIYETLEPRWYEAAARRLLEGDSAIEQFAIFSDDPDWAASNIRLPGRTVLVSGSGPAGPTEDLAILRACRHHVIANSTFGWWGARLAALGGTVIAPARWRRDRPIDAGFLPRDWIDLPNESC